MHLLLNEFKNDNFFLNELKISDSFNHVHVVPKPYDFLYSVGQKEDILRIVSLFFFGLYNRDHWAPIHFVGITMTSYPFKISYCVLRRKRKSFRFESTFK